jgi:hypothetical protein
MAAVTLEYQYANVCVFMRIFKKHVLVLHTLRCTWTKNTENFTYTLSSQIVALQEKILLEQEMATALRSKDYRKAVMLAFELKQPFRLLQVIDEIISQGDEREVLDEIVARFTDEQVHACFHMLMLSQFVGLMLLE